MKYLWLIFPVISGAVLNSMGHTFTDSWQYWVITMCCIIPTVKAMEK